MEDAPARAFLTCAIGGTDHRDIARRPTRNLRKRNFLTLLGCLESLKPTIRTGKRGNLGNRVAENRVESSNRGAVI